MCHRLTIDTMVLLWYYEYVIFTRRKGETMPEMTTKSAQFTAEWAARIDMMARLKPEFPKGVTSVLQEGVRRMWAIYGPLADMMAKAAAKAREDTNEPA